MQKILYSALGCLTGVALTFIVTSFALSNTNSPQDIGNTATDDIAAIAMTDICTSDDPNGSGQSHAHPVLNVSDTSLTPSVNHLVFPDAMDGYNVQIMTQNFKFTPASINRAVVENEGHAHIYVNGEKIARVYSNWYHLSTDLFKSGVNLVSVTLNANDHSEWAVNNETIASTVRVIR